MTDRVKTPSVEALIGMKTEEGITIARKRDTGQVSDDKLAAILSHFWSDSDSVTSLIKMGSIRKILDHTSEPDPAYPNIYRPENNIYPLVVSDEREFEAHAKEQGIKNLFLFEKDKWVSAELSYTWQAAATSISHFGSNHQ